MNRRVTGSKAKDENTTVGKIILQLKKDRNMVADRLPWEEVKDDSKRAS